jgi:hypothetical protein
MFPPHRMENSNRIVLLSWRAEQGDNPEGFPQATLVCLALQVLIANSSVGLCPGSRLLSVGNVTLEKQSQSSSYRLFLVSTKFLLLCTKRGTAKTLTFVFSAASYEARPRSIVTAVHAFELHNPLRTVVIIQ